MESSSSSCGGVGVVSGANSLSGGNNSSSSISGRQQLPETSADICPYATSAQQQQEQQQQRLNNFNVTQRCSTLGRLKNLEMTEYQKQKLLNEANTVRIKVDAVHA